MNYRIWCEVYSGITGHRASWLKADNCLVTFTDRQSALNEALRLNQLMNNSRAKASFRYSVEPLTNG